MKKFRKYSNRVPCSICCVDPHHTSEASHIPIVQANGILHYSLLSTTKIPFGKLIVAILCALILQACSPSTPPSAGLSYVEMSKVPIAVSNVSVCVLPSVRENNPLTSLPLSSMLKQWAVEHWQPTGGRCQMVFNINKLDIKEEVIVCKSGPDRWLTVNNSDIYKAKMMVSCCLYLPHGTLVGKTDFTISYEQYVPENYTLAQRKALWNQVYEGLINQLTTETNVHVPGMMCKIEE